MINFTIYQLFLLFTSIKFYLLYLLDAIKVYIHHNILNKYLRSDINRMTNYIVIALMYILLEYILHKHRFNY